eukprot:3059723-Amphidinium_carterae.1
MEQVMQQLTAITQQLVVQQQGFNQALDALTQQTRQQGEALQNLQPRGDGSNLVDTRGIAKPEPLTSAIANEHAQYVVWRLKLNNWISSAYPQAMEVLDELEQKSNTEFTHERFNELLAEKGQWLYKLSNQLRAILVSVCLEEPLGLVRNTPRTPQQGLEALRRLNDRFDPLGPRAAKTLLHKILSTKSVPILQLRSALEEVKKHCEEYRVRTGNALAEDLKMVVVEQLLQEPLRTHISLNTDRLATYTTLRAEVV